MNKTCFLLISVFDGDILSEQFKTRKDAWYTMRNEMIQHCNPDFREEVEECLMRINYDDDGDEYNDFAIGKMCAYMNDYVARYSCDWRIIEIEV